MASLADSGQGRQLTSLITTMANDLEKQRQLSPVVFSPQFLDKVGEKVTNVLKIREAGLTLKTALSLPVERLC